MSITGLPEVDADEQGGPDRPGHALKTRTSYEPQDPMGVDIATRRSVLLSRCSTGRWIRAKRICRPRRCRQDHRLHARWAAPSCSTPAISPWARCAGANSPGEQTLRRLTAGLDLPPLEPVPADHVLTKAFYILQGISRPLGRRPGLGGGAAARRSKGRERGAGARRRRRFAGDHRRQ